MLPVETELSTRRRMRNLARTIQLTELKPAAIDMRMVLSPWKLFILLLLPGSIEQLWWFWARWGHNCCDSFHCVRFKITGLWIRKHECGVSVGEKKDKHYKLLLFRQQTLHITVLLRTNCTHYWYVGDKLYTLLLCWGQTLHITALLGTNFTHYCSTGWQTLHITALLGTNFTYYCSTGGKLYTSLLCWGQTLHITALLGGQTLHITALLGTNFTYYCSTGGGTLYTLLLCWEQTFHISAPFITQIVLHIVTQIFFVVWQWRIRLPGSYRSLFHLRFFAAYFSSSSAVLWHEVLLLVHNFLPNPFQLFCHFIIFHYIFWVSGNCKKPQIPTA